MYSRGHSLYYLQRLQFIICFYILLLSFMHVIGLLSVLSHLNILITFIYYRSFVNVAFFWGFHQNIFFKTTDEINTLIISSVDGLLYNLARHPHYVSARRTFL
jgi:hypothetical protein